jgi:hypothetical protein
VKQFTGNIFFNSSWALFSPLTGKEQAKLKKEGTTIREYGPFSYFGKTFSFEKSEQNVINSYREWIAKAFAKNRMLSDRYITKLKDVPE